MRVEEASFYFTGRICATERPGRFPENKQTVKAYEVAARFESATTWQAFRAAWRQAERLSPQGQYLVIDAMRAARVRLTQTREGNNARFQDHG